MRALALFSGGLDSMLAMKLLTDQGIDVIALHIDTGFGPEQEKFDTLKRRAELVGASFEVVDIRSSYLQDVLLNPKYGYGSKFNPCIDCHAYMFKTALAMLPERNASFIITGEVIGQRPMSQRKEAMAQVKNLADDSDDLILRPMSAKLLPPTRPEREGWVDRERLLGLSGRDRKPQLALAASLGISDYATPGGGCLLTIESFAHKMRDYLKFDSEVREIDAKWLKIGRHLRLKDGAKMIIGRDEGDNIALREEINDKFNTISFSPDVVGAASFLSKGASEADTLLAAKLALAYTRATLGDTYTVKVGEIAHKIVHEMDKSAAQEYLLK
ncbi:argininosuccinate synthase domain-containing protein [Campylobacter sp. 19-13652]|uniref:argininosuccinate synthase domain-containing protein n=1 Tax=Campylobacter sp. 19-13652 TaxID=2840180 RepID=UPI001C76670E|nr:argininosuccinate synthase domain-containing protein [Campylobacter sp. 19-13652]BCX78777.1 ATP-binding protein [Campylobacter sp. 19-13652]